ncbi:mitochondrial ribosomal protein S15 [Lactarius pseudohatsudake]|nr:mitochondrial ribosomal protein S15 [Lactarius pseudohatsudake]
MLRAYLLRGSNVAAATVTRHHAPLHTTAVLSVESARKRQARLTRQKNIAKREELQQKAAATRPHVVLGTVSGDDATWASCDLARALVGPDELARSAPSQDVHLAAAGADVHVPPSLAFGIRAREQRMLFAHLPLLSADMSTRREMNGMQGMRVEDMAAHHERELAAGVAQANAVARLVDLRNANAAGVAFENRRRVVAAFSEPGKPDDTGRTEVQAALLTLQIRNMWTHLSGFKRDVANRRNLRRLVHQRAKLLKYLKRTNRDRYERVLERLGLAPGAVEGELVV